MNGPEKHPAGEGKRRVDPFTLAFRARKEALYDRVKLSVRQLDVIIWLAGGALAVVVALIILEAAGVFKL